MKKHNAIAQNLLITAATKNAGDGTNLATSATGRSYARDRYADLDPRFLLRRSPRSFASEGSVKDQ
jgi:hypothetical protein